MAQHSVSFGTVEVDAPSNWQIVQPAKDDYPPFILADISKNMGVLRFAIASYDGDDMSLFTLESLIARAKANKAPYGSIDPNDIVTLRGELRLGAISFRKGENFMRTWCVCEGRNSARATYTCPWGREDEQLGECEAIVRSLRFRVPNRSTKHGEID